jgi:DNA-binding response OmpR family regulator
VARILVVEDETPQRFAMASLLERSGHEARATSNPEAAIEGAAEFRPAVLVTDWMLKAEQTGLDVAESLRRMDPTIGLVFITALPEEEARQMAGHLDNFEVVQKPCEFYELLEAVQRML